MPDNIVGTQFPVIAPNLDQAANVETAFELFYVGDGGTNDGVETHLLDLSGRIEVLEQASAAGGIFHQNSFKVYKTVGNTSSAAVSFGVSSLTSDRSITIPDSAGTMVLEAATQTLSNKTITASSNTIYVRQGNFRLQRTDSDYVNFNVDAVTGIQNAAFRDFGAGTLTDYFAFEDLAQTLKAKTLVNYKENVLTGSSGPGATATVNSNDGSIAYVTFSGSGVVNVTNLADGKSIVLVCKAPAAATATPTVQYGGATTIKWSGGSAPGAITANRFALISLSMIGPSNEVFGSYLGEFY